MPNSASPARHAQALQLKGYLSLHEQFMANYLAQIADIPELFSVVPKSDQSYAAMVLENDDVPRVEELYPRGVEGQRQMLTGTLAEFDDWVERRHRLLNRLLAMHGHDETRQLLDAIALARHLDDRQALRAKQDLLQNIPEFGRRRVCGGCLAVGDETGVAYSGVERNLAILFGVPPHVGGDRPAGTDAVPSRSIRVYDHILLRSALGSPGADSPGPDFFLFRISIVISAEFLDSLAGEAHTLIGRAIAICCPAHIAARTVVLEQGRFEALLNSDERLRDAARREDAVALASESLALASCLLS